MISRISTPWHPAYPGTVDDRRGIFSGGLSQGFSRRE